jgi:hypothetical protein
VLWISGDGFLVSELRKLSPKCAAGSKIDLGEVT